MTSLAVRNTSAMTETPWDRLHRLIERRRKVLGLTLEGIQVAGGPSPRWVQKLRGMSGPPSDRMRRPMRKLDAALVWPEGTSWGLVAEDRSAWSEMVLTDEEEQLMEAVDEAAEFGLAVTMRLRAIPAGAERDDLMRQIASLLGMEP